MKVEKESVFDVGNLSVKAIKVNKSDGSRPPVEVTVMAPEAKGSYPVVLFCHGYCTQTTWYSQLLRHISSHGYIIVAPQFYKWMVICMKEETKTGAKVAKWVASGLEMCLPPKLKPDLSKLALMGHSRGGKIAFSLALALQQAATSLSFKALVGLDPVAGLAPSLPTWWVEPPGILSYVPRSFSVGMPVAVIGTGLSNRGKSGLIPPPAPDGYNHSEFFNESKPPCCYFLAKDYGHCDMLDDERLGIASLVCRSGKGCKEKLRRGVGGVVVSFLHAFLGADSGLLEGIVAEPGLAPITFDPVIYVNN